MFSRSTKTFASVLAVVLASVLVPPAAAEDADVASAFIDAPILRAEGRTSALVHVRSDASLADGLDAARAAGTELGTRYDAIKVFVAYGTPAQFRALARDRSIEFLEANRRLRYFTDTSHQATRGQNVLDGEVTMPDGTVIDGSGIGVAVVDSGVDGTHPDLDDRMGGNVKIICTTPQPVGSGATGGFTECRGPKTAVPMEDTDHPSAGGHGTHVAGTVAGTGEASDGLWHGAAPGATLYGVSVGTVISVENGLDGLAWVLENHDQVTPAIKVVNNSWGSGHRAYSPDGDVLYDATWKLQEALVEAGVTVVFAAGNSGGSGANATTSAQCVNPTPGVICVANYSDDNSGTRDGSIDSTSSRGKTSDPKTWPDLAAPGTQITATCRLTLPVCNAHFGPELDPVNHYATLSGTSMAAPHVAGIVAQILQADPSLAPGDIENLLEDTAYKFDWGSDYTMDDPFNTDDSSSFEKGHGLVDAAAALRTIFGIPEPDPTTDPDPDPDPDPQPASSRFYFHTGMLVNTVDKFFDTATFDSNEPQLCCGFHGIAFDTPLGGANGDTIYDATWTGVVPHEIRRLEIEFWDASTAESAMHGAAETYSIGVWQGNTRIALPPLEVAVDASKPVHVKHMFTTMLDAEGNEVPLAIDPAGAPISIEIGPEFLNDTTAIMFDAVEYPSGFTAFSTADDVTEEVTTLSFTTDSAAAGQYSDSATIEAQLTDASGAAVEGAEVLFELAGEGGTRTWTATTANGGVASTSVALDLAPGSYDLSAGYAGAEGSYMASTATGTFTVDPDDSRSDLTGNARSRTLTVVLTDADSGSGLAGSTVEFFANGASIGTAITDAEGAATLVTKVKKKTSYEAVFGGDGFYLGSSDTYQQK